MKLGKFLHSDTIWMRELLIMCSLCLVPGNEGKFEGNICR